MDWAMTQNNLGAALQSLGRREESPQLLEEAIAAYENALKVITREKMPMSWAMTLANLAAARMTLADGIGDIEIAALALDDFNEVVEFFRDVSHAQYMELAEDQRKKAQALVEALSEE
jgi:tetratricopeptide (TPR) repeat protein